MTRVARQHRLVSRDIEAAEYMERDSLDAALRYFDAVEETLIGLAEFPGKGAPREFTNPRLGGLRSWPVQGFHNHLVLYQPANYGLYVLAVLHGARDWEAVLDTRV